MHLERVKQIFVSFGHLWGATLKLRVLCLLQYLFCAASCPYPECVQAQESSAEAIPCFSPKEPARLPKTLGKIDLAAIAEGRSFAALAQPIMTPPKVFPGHQNP